MAYYLDITADQLTRLRDGLDIIERLYNSTGEDLPRLYLYGLSSDPNVLDAAKEAIVSYGDEEEISEEDIQLSEIVVELQLSGDILYYLMGSGLHLDKGDEFAYQAGPGEGVREIGFKWVRRRVTVTLGSFTKMALATDSGWADRFLTQYGNKIPAQIQKKVQRNEPATTPPVAPAKPPVAPAVPKQTSVHGAKQLRDLLDNFLGD